ncbi:MAG: DUF3422 family protein [Zetaproteobacteria bacterium]|nr:MAG: DUF3422 family protein [Zetaproteobacteria bacterium]
MKLPVDLEERYQLNDELHIHPYEPLEPPTRVLTLVMVRTDEQRADELLHLKRLSAKRGVEIETSGLTSRLSCDDFLLKVESHQDFTRYKFIARPDPDNLAHPCTGDPLASPPLSLLPQGWLEALPGKLLLALDLMILPYPVNETHAGLMRHYACCFDPSTLCASQIGRSKSLVLTDFRIGENRFSRMLLFSRAKMPTQLGRLAYRLIDIETYRMLAMRILSPARGLRKQLPKADRELNALTTAISGGSGLSDEQLLERLTTLAAKIEAMVSAHYRPFSLASARFELVRQRLDELYEQPVGPQSTLGRFLRRRLNRARSTAESAFEWLEQLAGRIAQASQLLRTRIDVHNEKQNRNLLAAMNRRFQLQLRLQQAAEMMTVAIFTYYGTNVLDYVYQEISKESGATPDSLLFKSIAAPALAIAAVWFVYRIRKKRQE